MAPRVSLQYKKSLEYVMFSHKQKYFKEIFLYTKTQPLLYNVWSSGHAPALRVFLESEIELVDLISLMLFSKFHRD